MFLITMALMPSLGLANNNPPRVLEDSPVLMEVLTAISSAYNNGPNFNGFYCSDKFSLFVIESQTPSFLWVDSEAIISHFSSLIENASDWANDRTYLEERKNKAVDDLKAILGEQKFKQYENSNLYGSEYRFDTYYIGNNGYQLWFEETWAN